MLILRVPLSCAQPLLIVTGEWPPYVSQELQDFGPAARIVRRAFELEGVDVEFRFFPWKRCEAMLDEGSAYGSFPYAMSVKRKRRWDFSLPLYRGETHVFFMKERYPTFEYHGVNSLRGYVVAGSLGHFLLERLANAEVKVDLAPDEQCSFRKLHSGRADVLLTEKHVGWYMIRSLFSGQESSFAMSRNSVVTLNAGMAVSRTYPDAARYTAVFNQGLAKLRETGEFDAIWDSCFK
ncbi:transporter substrate-binding domain-containing protein [Desulfovibrio mangrovi]|uniref:substrate-binding periplasmic protein n=1 Tax=Desulfovibrio mangrovi TaxID=2976983 RepID=UPI0022471020|nr:transporter substrate-binding domain-containing protein [Desulfovibrio mangrovi]UZP66084.1 transporter substrate-binding domain-containing protein [Desulfovibrio mangrovi]